MTKPKRRSKPLEDLPTDIERALGRRLDAAPDRIDLRDWFYEPTLAPLPETLVNCHRVPEVLDQGREGPARASPWRP